MIVAVNIFVFGGKLLLAGLVGIAAAITAIIFALAYSAEQPAMARSYVEADAYELEVKAASRKQTPVYAVGRDDNKLALTIDAAWGSDNTSELLAILEEKGVRATWFLCGYWVDKYPKEVKAIFDKGHELGNHTATHPHMTQLDEAGIAAELQKVELSLEKLTGAKPTLFRAPFGEYDDRTLSAVRNLGYEAIQWSVSTDDWKEGQSAGLVLERALKGVSSGGIILCHNNAETICQYLPQLIDGCRAKGFEFVTVSELLLDGEATIDQNGIQRGENAQGMEE